MASIVPKETVWDASTDGMKSRNSLGSSTTSVVRFRKCTFILWIAIILFLVVALIVFIVLFAVWVVKLRQSEEGTQAKDNRTEETDYCDLSVCKKKFDLPPLLIISSDGFRNSYLAENITPAIHRLINCGTHSKYMIPAFPSKTFPNHYTIVTGLYPPWNGIVDNSFYDPNFQAYFKKNANHSGWFLGEPIWNTVQKYGLKSAVYFWPGSEAPVNEHRPNYWKVYNPQVPFTARIDQAIEWLNLPDSERPAIIQVYFEQPDIAGHAGGPHSEEVRTAMILIDGMINYLTQRLLEEGLMGCINLILLSDHGMQRMNSSRSVVAEKYLGPNFNDLFFEGVVARIQANASSLSPAGQNADAAIDEMISTMSCKKGDNYLMYKKNLVPIRFHYAGSPRIGDVVIKGRPGVCIFLTEDQMKSYKLNGDHGFDNRIVSMRAIFVAIGPDFASKTEISDFENIELYNLFAYLLRVSAAPNNGTNGTLFTALRNPPPVPETTTFRNSSQCTNMMQIKKCSSTFGCQVMTDTYRNCSATVRSSIGPAISFTNELCSVHFCDAIIHFDKTLQQTIMVEGILRKDYWTLSPGNDCVTYVDNVTKANSCEDLQSANYTTISLFANIDRYNTLDLARFVVPDTFANGTWQYFLEEVGKYLGYYSDLAFFAGPAYDQNGDGVRDDDDTIRNSTPSHIFFVLLRCRNGEPARGSLCKDVIFIPYILPIASHNFNCLRPSEYLFDNTARLRDIELLSGMQFFTNRATWSAAEAIQLRTWLPESVWSVR